MTVRFQHGTNKSRDSKGNYYVTLTQRGPKEEGAAMPFGEPFEKDEVWAAYWQTLSDYLADQRAELVEWRCEPQLIEDHGCYAVRSRLSVIEHG